MESGEDGGAAKGSRGHRGARSWSSVPMSGVGRHRVRYSVLGPRPTTYYGDRLQRLAQTREMLMKTDYTELVGLRVRRMRQARGWTQRELLARIDDEDVQRPVAEAELTLLRYLRAIGMPPHEALAALTRA